MISIQNPARPAGLKKIMIFLYYLDYLDLFAFSSDIRWQ